MKIYIGKREKDGCHVFENGRKIELEPSLSLRNHSPTGFEWGYRGSGPHQLALAILLDFTNNEIRAMQYYNQFVDEFVVDFAQDGFVLTEAELAIWIKKKIFEDESRQAE